MNLVFGHVTPPSIADIASEAKSKIPSKAKEPPSILAFPLPREGVEKHLFAVIPAKAGIPKHLQPMDSCLRRNDRKVDILHLSTLSCAGMTAEKECYEAKAFLLEPAPAGSRQGQE
jgi:hypothetical protein